MMGGDQHAVVLGAGVAGLLAARVLSESFAQVTVIERDPLPAVAQPRRGVPQARHIHGLQARGVEILGELFPGLLEEMVAAGASRIADLSQLHFRVTGHLLSQQPQPIAPLLLSTRPFLEHCMRRRVERIAGVVVQDGFGAAGLLYTSAAGKDAVVRGVRVIPRGGGNTEEVPADLVVDATGRGSRTPVWLTELGYDRPPEERVAVRVRYASQTLRLPGERQPLRFVLDGRSSARPLGAALFGCENDTWVFTVMGAEHTFPEAATRDWMVQVAASILPAHVVDAVRAGEPLAPVCFHRHPASIRRRYERLTRFPAGLLVTGDALCALNPVYGQGMSVAAEHALALRRSLRRGTNDLAARFLHSAAAPTANAWSLAAGADLAYPDVQGNPTRAMRFIGRCVQRVLVVAERDPEVARRFMAVSGLINAKTAIFRPRVLAPVICSAISSATRPVDPPARDVPQDGEQAVRADH